MHTIFQKFTDAIRNEHNFLLGEGYTRDVPWFTKAIYSMKTVNKAKNFKYKIKSVMRKIGRN